MTKQMFRLPSLAILFLLMYSNIFAQGLKDLDYSKIDSFALSIKKKYTDLDKLTWVLTNQYKEDHEKVRAIFRWMTSNISYDVKLYDKTQLYWRLNKKQKEKFWRKNTKEKVIQRTFRKKKGVCEGYALLFKTICQKAGVQAAYIAGYDKQEIGKKNSFGHAWNGVKINERWYLLDITWASGYLQAKKQGEKKKRKKNKLEKIFIQELNEAYFLTPSYLIIYDHFPDSSRWQLLASKVDKSTFKKFPIVGNAFFKHRTLICEADTYTVKASIGQCVNFRFRLSGEIKHIDVVINQSKYSQSIDFQKEGNEYYFTKTFSKKGKFLLEFFINQEHFLTQKIVVQ